MPAARYVQYDYGEARKNWGNSVSDAIWSKFKSNKTKARASLKEHEILKGSPRAANVRDLIKRIVARSLGKKVD